MHLGAAAGQCHEAHADAVQPLGQRGGGVDRHDSPGVDQRSPSHVSEQMFDRTSWVYSVWFMTNVHGPDDRLRSMELVAEAFGLVAAPA